MDTLVPTKITDPHASVAGASDEALVIRRGTLVQALVVLVALLAGSGSTAIVLGGRRDPPAPRISDVEHGVATLEAQVGGLLAPLAAATEATSKDRDRLAKLEERTEAGEHRDASQDARIRAMLEVHVVGLRFIAERLQALEARGGAEPEPIPNELLRRVNRLDLWLLEGEDRSADR